MAELNTAEDDQLIDRVYSQALEARAANKPLEVPDQIVYEIEMLSQEVNSGASFEQYCRWATIEELSMVVDRLTLLGLADVADITRRALGLAFPQGLPKSAEAKDALTEWTPAQEVGLQELADQFTQFNGPIRRALASFYRAK